MPRRDPRSPYERMMARTKHTDGGCLEFTGSRSSGYGAIGVNRRPVRCHRIAWEHHHGPIPAGMFVCHRCDNKPCCNIDHLFLGTRDDNIRDMVEKGRQSHATGHPGSRNYRAKLTESDIRVIYDLAGSGWLHREIAAWLGVSRPLIGNILHGRVWRHVDRET